MACWVYFLWIPYRDTLRTFQNYLVKMPQETISLFPRLRALADQAAARPSGPGPASLAEDAVMDAAGKVGRRGGGKDSSSTKCECSRRGIGDERPTEFYSKNWDVEDVHGMESYDLICRRGGKVKHVEVKGPPPTEPRSSSPPMR
jgi:hypothetical protein